MSLTERAKRQTDEAQRAFKHDKVTPSPQVLKSIKALGLNAETRRLLAVTFSGNNPGRDAALSWLLGEAVKQSDPDLWIARTIAGTMRDASLSSGMQDIQRERG